MKRIIPLIIFITISIGVYSQWINNHNLEGKCSHASSYNEKLEFNTDYNWQSKYLFDYDVTSYMLDIEVSDTTTYISGNATINSKAIVLLDTFAFELIPEQIIDSIIINGIVYPVYYRDGDNVIVPIAEIGIGSNISAQVFYHGQPPSGDFFTGVTTDMSLYWLKNVTWTLSEPFSAKDWFPVKQDLLDKADSAWLFFTTSETNMVGSEGLLTNIKDMGNGKLRYEWKTYYPIDYYLISFAVADYVDYSIYAHPEQMGEDSLLIQNFLYNSQENIDGKKEDIAKTADIMELYSDLFNLYPFHNEKYGHCQAQLGGGMEHQTMSTMGNFSFHLIAHELGHMWFGDNVTCATWSDIWINEGFATYSDYLANEFLLGSEAASEFIIGAQQHAMTSETGSIYVPANEVYPGNESRIFSGSLSYDKGASIIHMLRHEIQNDELFFDILKTFQTNYGGGTATGEDFKNMAEELTGMDFETYFEQWYYGQGFPRYSFKYWNDKNNTFFLSSTQTTSSFSTTLFEMLLDFRLVFDDGTDTLVHFNQTENLNLFTMNFNKNVLNVEFDPFNWTLEEVVSISHINEIQVSPLYFTLGPNPATDKLTLFFLTQDNASREILITNTKGQQIYLVESSENTMEIATSFMKSGVYFVSVSDGKNSFVKKFVKR